MSLISLSICLSDLPKDRIKTAANGKKYIDLTCTSRRETGKYGETHTVYVSQSKEEREANTPITYVGSGKEFMLRNNSTQSASPQPQTAPQSASNGEDDLPF